MKAHKAILAGAMVVFAVTAASAQQRPTPTHMALPPPPKALQSLRFPAPADKYDQLAQWYLALFRQFPARFHVAQADTDLLILLLKDCTARIEADGIVTEGEHKYCRRQTLAKAHELMVPYMLQERGDGHAGH